MNVRKNARPTPQEPACRRAVDQPSLPLAGALLLWWRGCISRPQLGMPVSTVGKVLRRLGISKLAALGPKSPVVRYQPEQPGELIHIDVKKLGRIEAAPTSARRAR